MSSSQLARAQTYTVQTNGNSTAGKGFPRQPFNIRKWQYTSANYRGIFAYLRITYYTFRANEGCLNLPEVLKEEVTIALPRHNRETPTNIFLAFILVFIFLLHSVSLSKLSLSQDLH